MSKTGQSSKNKSFSQEVKLSRLKLVAAWGMANSMSASLPYPKVLRVFYSMTKDSLCVCVGGTFPSLIWVQLIVKVSLAVKRAVASSLTHTVQVPLSPLGHTKKHEMALLFLKELGSEYIIHTICRYLFTHGEIRSWT